MNFNIFNSLILAGVIQGFLFASIWLFTNKYRAKNTSFLIALIIVYSLSNLQFYLLDIGVFEYGAFYDLYYIPFSLIMPALFLLYGQTLLNEHKKITKREYLLFVPFTIVILLLAFYRYQLIVNNKPSNYSHFLDDIPNWSEYIAIFFSIAVTIYLYLKINFILQYVVYSTTRVRPRLKWFKTVLIFQFFSITLWLVSEIAFQDLAENYYYYPLWIVLAIIIYWMGHVGMYTFGITQERKEIRKRTRERYSIKELDKSKSELLRKLENFLITERNFLDPQISQEKVAQNLGVSAGHLSKVINTELQHGFKDYLNNLRVEEAKLHLQNPEFSNYTLAAIGLEAGFNSKSAFNSSFKKITGITPSQFKNEHIN